MFKKTKTMLDKKDRNWVVKLEECGLMSLVALELAELIGMGVITEKLLKAIARKAHEADDEMLDTTNLVEMVVYYICTGVRLYPVKYIKFKNRTDWLVPTYNMVEEQLGDIEKYGYKLANMKQTMRCYQLKQCLDRLLQDESHRYYRTEIPSKYLRKYEDKK